ncbi:prostaglandin E receptor 1c (subtype EP1) [Archocentrus centrarchus]|uniref:prostaglandin E receptor 1c (subtype EP1) n=1 Tax=Archocentrus centrarchus TaxID=63155 RepID=UPI0011EA27E3|nr:prostaglandin E2 receptor EP1 subtype-like [Archocentrus centrarchus]
MSVKMMTTCQPNQTCHQPNCSTAPPIQDLGLAISCFTMLFGTISNLAALGILAKSRLRFCRQSKAPFLILTVALLLADLGGHVILGSFAMYLHISRRNKIEALQSSVTLCNVFGANMVFFGLCPLLFGCAMAVERCVAITKPFRVYVITVAHVGRVMLLLSSLALVLAVLPLFIMETYTIQYPCTWCFLRVTYPHCDADNYPALIFSCLGLSALTLSLFSNTKSVAALMRARMRTLNAKTNSTARCARRVSCASSSSLFFSLDVEVMVQLVVITVVSCVCWSPFLIQIIVMQFKQSRTSYQEQERFIHLALRIASWNQILDPWVYILLRKTVLFRFYEQRRTLTRK